MQVVVFFAWLYFCEIFKKKKLADNSCATHGKRYTFYYEKSLKLSGSAVKDFSLRPQAFSVLIFALKNNKRQLP